MSIETASLPHAAEAADGSRAVDEMMSAFEAFQQANDERLAELEARHAADVLLEEKIGRLDARLTDLQAAAGRPALPSAADDADMTRKAFDGFVRHGTEHLELKAAADTSGDAGVFVPQHIEQQLHDALTAASPLARLARQRVVSANSVKIITHTSETEAAWAGETANRTQTDVPGLATVDIPLNELYANPAVTQRFLDDAAIDVEQWLLDSLALSFIDLENTSFVDGSGANQPKGLLQSETDRNAAAAGKVLSVKTGQRNGLPSSGEVSWLMETAFKLPPRYRAGAAWLMNARTLATVRNWRDGQGNHIWRPPVDAGSAGEILGFPVHDEPAMPDAAQNKLPIAFGDFSRAYTIVRKPQTQLIRDPYSNKPYVHFYATRQVGGAVVDPKAFLVVSVAA